jgi:hypothetical protein
MIYVIYVICMICAICMIYVIYVICMIYATYQLKLNFLIITIVYLDLFKHINQDHNNTQSLKNVLLRKQVTDERHSSRCSN